MSLLLTLPMTTKAQTALPVPDSEPLLLKIFAQQADSLRQVLLSRPDIRIVHLGDSHVRGQVFPAAVRDSLLRAFPAWTYSFYGINGATYQSFFQQTDCKPLLQGTPDLVILSFGTNESHDYNLPLATFAHYIRQAIDHIREYAPEALLLLTTPPGSYWLRNHNRVPNPRTRFLSDVILRVAKERKLLAWDLNALSGGNVRWWYSAGMLRPDRVHYTRDGYQLQGNYLATALLHFLLPQADEPAETTTEDE